MRKLLLERAVGRILAVDIAGFDAGGMQVRWPQGHVLTVQDLEPLRSIGRSRVWVLAPEPAGRLGENEAAERLAQAVIGPGVVPAPPSMGRVDLFAAHPGLLRLQVSAVHRFNRSSRMALVTRLPDIAVSRHERVASVRVHVLSISSQSLARAVQRTAAMVCIWPFSPKRIMLLSIGQELLTGRARDRVRPALSGRLAALGCAIDRQETVPDEPQVIAAHVRQAEAAGFGMLLVAGGFGPDPDDASARGIVLSGARLVRRNGPVLPGSRTLLAYLGSMAVIGVPASAMHAAAHLVDLLLPRVLAGVTISSTDLARLGVGGLLEP